MHIFPLLHLAFRFSSYSCNMPATPQAASTPVTDPWPPAAPLSIVSEFALDLIHLTTRVANMYTCREQVRAYY